MKGIKLRLPVAVPFILKEMTASLAKVRVRLQMTKYWKYCKNSQLRPSASVVARRLESARGTATTAPGIPTGSERGPHT